VVVHEKEGQISGKQVWASLGRRYRITLVLLPKYSELKIIYMKQILLQHPSKLTNKGRGRGVWWFMRKRDKY